MAEGLTKNGKKMGRPANVAAAADMMNRDVDFQRKLYEDSKEIYAMLLKHGKEVVRGDVKETVVTQKGEVFEKEVSRDVAAKWAKILKEITMDKILADKKETGSAKDKGRGVGLDLEKALMEAQKKRMSEKGLEKQGKLVRLGG